MLTSTFSQLVNKYVNDCEWVTNLGLEIFAKYSDAKRYYHNRSHIEDLRSDLNEVKEVIIDWDTTLFAIFYHDIIYKA